MAKIIVTTDSGADLSKELIEEFNIEVIPLGVIMDDTVYMDGSIPIESVYEYYNRTKKIPSTTAANVHQYEQFFDRINRENPGCDIINIAYSSNASSTCHHAELAAKEFENVTVVDSLSVTGGTASIAIRAAEIIKERPEIAVKDLVEELKDLVKRIKTTFLPTALEYLKAGGRVSNAQYLGATLLKIKPKIDIENGFLVAGKKYRGSMKAVALNYMEEFIKENKLSKKVIYLMSTVGLDSRILDMMTEKAKEMGFEKIRYTVCGCVISCHGGPGAIGLSGFAEEE
ncbi:DegV family protein [Eubacterium oxidoreducens]|uniref:EDD domain protein, DegV family n=1 Tax=Eubacterium oxidoreducens TaxID=1732 RepID=A0A1G5ZZN8_EUBOX|nr:DegV family protein [Eubacterium oxidoreducens]SDB01627.1 EDD domain protein, DegV family [Eubacterium oxidoreducens]